MSIRSLGAAALISAFTMGCDDGSTADNDTLLIFEDAFLESDTRFNLTDASVGDPPSVDAEPPAGPDALPTYLPEDGLPVAGDCAPDPMEWAVHGRMYIDEDNSELSVHTGGFDEGDRPTEIPLRLLGPDGAEDLDTCSDGSYTSSRLTPGRYLVQIDVPDGQRCTTANCPGRFARAIAEGRSPKMVTFGDSIAVIGEPPMFPERVRALFSPLADIQNVNVAIGGTTSRDWLPETNAFTSRVLPNLQDADLIIITIGGNDIVEYIGRIGIPNDIPAAVEGAKAVVRQVVRNVIQTIDAIREVNPDVDIAYCLYANYSQATGNAIWGLLNGILGPDTVGEILELARSYFPTDDPHLILVDMYGAADGLPLHDYLYDELHFNDLGQTLYAEEVFETLGGVLIGPNPLGEDGASYLGLRRDYGVSPPDVEP